jgi:nitrate reductase (NAD(P)H)
VEVTLDGGETWQVCTLEHPERPTKYGKYWCWCFWSVEVEVLDLLGSKEIAVRAWDEAMNTQPEKLIWNLMVRITSQNTYRSVQYTAISLPSGNKES